jgi:hypothetical protein
MNDKTKLAIRETSVTVFSGLIVSWPLNLGLLYISLEVLFLSLFWTSVFATAGMTLAALVRVFIIRMYYSKED